MPHNKRDRFGQALRQQRSIVSSPKPSKSRLRASLARFGLENTFLQLNVTNLFEERYFGNLSTATSASGTTRYTFGAPRTVIGSIHFAF